MRLPILDSIVISVSLPVLKDRTGKLCAKKVLCLAGFVLLLAAANYNAEAATVGFTDVFSGMTTATTRRAMPFTMPEDGTITSVSMYHYEYSGEDKYMLLGVYSDTGSDRPGERLALTQETITSHSTGWQTIDLINPVFVAGGADIWLAWVYEDNPGIFYRSGSPSRADSGMLWNSPPRMPDPFGESTIGGTQYSIYATYTPGLLDTDPPTPNPATWASQPSADGPFSISMTATAASDPSGVQYYFEETSGNSGADDSSWQISASYTDNGLIPETQYTYRLKTRDQSANQNEGDWSVPKSATTEQLYSVECPMGDLDKNCKVDLADVLILVGQWLDAEGCTGHPDDCADLDEQGGVTATDFAIIAANWLEDGFVLIINEVMSDNETTIQDEYDEYDDWIEIYNPTGLTIGMGGLFLADDGGNVWEIPAGVAISPGEYKLFWADNDWPAQGNTHTNFGLSNDGDGVTLYDTDGVTVIDTVSFGPLADDMSYGRWPDITGDWMHMSDPTPGTANTVGLAGEVYFSRPSGTFTASFNLGLTTKEPATIYYTTDGSEPDDSDTLYTSPFTVSSTTWVRARAYQSGLLPGPIVSKNYIALDADVQSFSSNLPIVIIDSFGYNIDSEWEPWTYYDYRPVISAFIDTDEVTGIADITDSADWSGYAGMRVRGDSSAYYYEKKQYSFETWDEYDQDKDVSILGFPPDSDWILHAPYSDKTLMRNVLAYKWSNKIGRYAVRTRFVEVFLNSDGGKVRWDGGTGSNTDYRGVYVFMEKIRRGQDRVDIERLESADNSEPDITGGYIIKHDKNTLGEETFTTTDDMTGALMYHEPRDYEITTQQKAYIKGYLDEFETILQGGGFDDPVDGYARYIDVDSFIDHHILVEMTKNIDGYRLSTYMYKDRGEKLNMGPIWDYNLAMGNCDYYPEWGIDWFQKATLWYYPAAGAAHNWYNRLMDDDEYLPRYADRWFGLREYPFSNGDIVADMDYYYDMLSAGAAGRNFTRWDILNTWVWPNWYYGSPGDPHTYEMEVDWVKTWLAGDGTPPGEYSDRLDWFDNNLGINHPPVIKVNSVNKNRGDHITTSDSISMTGGGTIYYTTDGSDPRAHGGGIAGTVYSGSFTLSESKQIKARIRYASDNWSALNKATFAVGPVADNLRITETMYHPQDTGDPINDPNAEFIELKNISGSTTINLNLVKFTDGIDFTFPDISLVAGDYIVVAKDLTEFASKYPGFSGTVVGPYTGRLNNAGERVTLEDAFGQTILNFGFKDGWYHITDGSGFSLSIIDPTSNDPNKWEYKEGWRASSVIKGTPGADDTGHVAAPGDIVINEVMTHTDDVVYGDWIELHNTTASSIDIGGWFLSDNDNDFKKYEIAAGTTILANGYKVFTRYEHFDNPDPGGDPGCHTPFGLSEHGETVYLSSGSGGELTGGFCIKENFKTAERDVTFGRHTKSAAAAYDVDFVAMSSPTYEAENTAGPKVGPVVISEIMYHPLTSNQLNNYAEYVELYNTSGGSVSLDGWQFIDETGGIEYYFPPGTSLASGQRILLVKNLVAFEDEFGPAPPTALEYVEGRLSNAGEKIQLSKPGDPEPDFIPYIRVDRVNYSDGSHPENFRELGYDPWPTDPDGGGDSLHRKVLGNYGNDVANWQPATPSPGS